MTALQSRINELDDFQVVRFFEHFSRQLIGGTPLSLDQIKSRIPDSVRRVEGFTQIQNLTPQQARRTLEPSVSVEMSRRILLNLAEDETFTAAIENSLDTYRDDELLADIILSVGLVASMLLITASVEFEGKIGPVTIKKGKIDSDTIKAVLEPITSSLTKIIRAS